MTDRGEALKNPSERPRVLIVDDSRIVRATIIKHVKGRYDFREETDGEAGWSALLTDPGIQVVISDLGMPKLDGYGLLARIRNSTVGRIRGLPFVIISGDEDEASRHRAQELGANDFITKGIGTAELLARLDSLVRLAATQHALDASRDNLLDDPVSGLRSRKYLDLQATQAMSHAARHADVVSVLVLGLDRCAEMRRTYGDAPVTQLGVRLGRLLATKLRREDSFGHFDDTRFAVVSPSTGAPGALVLAGRLRDAVAQINVGFQGRKVELSLSIGIATSPPDVAADAAAFFAIAAQRVQAAASAGGDRVVGAEPTGEGTAARPLPSLEHALAVLATADDAALRGHAAGLALRVLPLLRLADAEYRLGLPLAEIEANLTERAQDESDARAKMFNSSAGNS